MALVVLESHVDVDNTVAEIADEVFRLADHLEMGELQDADASYDQLRIRMEALRTYITAKMAQQEGR